MLKRILFVTAMLSGGVGLAACAGGGGAMYGGSVSAGVSYGADPELAEIQPDVWVVEGYDEPVFFSDNYYWRFSGGAWYRSDYYDRDWVTVYDVPYRLRSIDRPTAYVRYYAPYGARVREGARGRVIVRNENNDRFRDHRNGGNNNRYNNERLDNRYPPQRYYDQQRQQQQAEMQRQEAERQRQQQQAQQQREQQQEARRQEQQQRQQQLDAQQRAQDAERARNEAERQQRYEQNRNERQQAAEQRQQRQDQQQRQQQQRQQQKQQNKKQKKDHQH